LWIGGTYAWQLGAARVKVKAAAPAATPAVVKPVEPPKPKAVDDLAGLYRAEAEHAMGSDWHKAEVLFQRAVELGDGSDRTAGELALSRGYASIERLEDGVYAPANSARLREYARAQLQVAAKKLPEDQRVAAGLASKALVRPAVKKTAVYRRRRWK